MEYDEAVEATGYEKALSESSYWYVAEAVDMLLGAKPIKGDGRDPTPALREIAYRAIDTGDLPCFGEPDDRMVRPADFIAWAQAKGWNIPPRIRALLNERPTTPIERNPDPEPEPLTEAPKVKHIPARKAAWIAELIQSWPEIAQAYKYPSAVHVMAWLKDHGAPDVFPKGQTNRNSLIWMKEDGTTRPVTKHRVETVLWELRDTGEIPPCNK